MATTFPTTLQDLDATRGTTGQPLSTPNHITHHRTEDDTIEALQAKVGVDGSAVTTTHDYKLSGVTGTDKAASKTGTETLTNKTLTTPAITTPTFTLGSDATGDIWYRHSDGTMKRLGIGTASQILNVSGGVPAWRDETAVANASATVKGSVELATAAEITAGTATGGTGAALAITPDQLALSTPIFNGSGLTNMVAQHRAVFKNGTTTKNAADASTTQTIAHGLGFTPKRVQIRAYNITTAGILSTADTVYNGTTQSSVSNYISAGGNYTTSTTFTLNTASGSHDQTGVITFDSTNISIAWTKTGSPTGTYTLVWEAEV